MPEITDIVTVNGSTALTAASFLGRDCSFPITFLEKTLMEDQVIAQLPIFIGYWNDDTPMPVLLTQAFDVDTSVVVDDCDSAVVTSNITEGELVAPNMRKMKLKSDPMEVDKLVPAFCRNRNISERNRRTLLNSDGSINTGNPYAINFARFVFSALAHALKAILSDRLLRGDESEDFGIDGLYTQLENGWVNGSPVVPDGLNKANVIDWNAATGGTGTGAPDDTIDPAKTFSLWGQTQTLPSGFNLAQFLDRYFFPADQAHWGAVDSWELHVPVGTGICIQQSVACIQPCGNNPALTIWDTGLRDRYANFSSSMVVKLYPSGKELTILESPHVEANTMWIIPRSIGGNPTYAAFFRDQDEMFAQLGDLANGFYGGGGGLYPDDEPLLIDVVPTIDLPFEARVIRQDVTKISIDCVEAGLMTITGVLAFERHRSLKIENISCATYIEALDSGVDIDGVAVETHA